MGVGVTWPEDEAGAQGTAEEVWATGRRAEVRHLDLTGRPGSADVVDDLADALGGVDVLVNNAGTRVNRPFHEHVPKLGLSGYCTAKGGLGLLTKAMAIELGEHGINVNAVAPGEVATPMTGQEDEDPHGAPRAGVPLNWPGDAREIAAAIAWLASEEATYATAPPSSSTAGCC